KAQEIDKANAQQVGDAKPSDGGVAPEQKMAKIEPKEMELQNGNKVAQQMGGNEKLNELGGKEQLGGGAGADIANVSPTQQPGNEAPAQAPDAVSQADTAQQAPQENAEPATDEAGPAQDGPV